MLPLGVNLADRPNNDASLDIIVFKAIIIPFRTGAILATIPTNKLPTVLFRTVNCCVNIFSWFDGWFIVLPKSPCAFLVWFKAVIYLSCIFSASVIFLIDLVIPKFLAVSAKLFSVITIPNLLKGSVSPTKPACNLVTASSVLIL